MKISILQLIYIMVFHLAVHRCLQGHRCHLAVHLQDFLLADRRPYLH